MIIIYSNIEEGVKSSEFLKWHLLIQSAPLDGLSIIQSKF